MPSSKELINFVKYTGLSVLENVEDGVAFLNYLHYLNACAYKTQFCSAFQKNPNLVDLGNVFLRGHTSE